MRSLWRSLFRVGIATPAMRQADPATVARVVAARKILDAAEAPDWSGYPGVEHEISETKPSW